jgi:hypothetical protein
VIHWHLAYIAAFLPAAPYFKSNDGRISAVCNDQYSSTLAMLAETANEAFKVYMTRKTQGWFRRLGCPRPSDAAASPGPGPRRRGERRCGWDASASPGTGSVGRRGSFRPHHGGGRRRSGAVANRGLGEVATRGPGVGHTPSKTSRLQPAPLIGQARLGRRVYSH